MLQSATGNFSLFLRKNSLINLFNRFLITALPTFLLTVTPSLEHEPAGWPIRIIKLGDVHFLAFAVNLRKSARLRRRTALPKANTGQKLELILLQ